MVSDSSPDGERSGDNNRSGTPITYTEYFEALCPIYIAYGMTYEQFWDGDPWMVRAYKKADEIKQERENQAAWLQGLYIYEAIADLSPILRAFSKARKPEPYPEEPYTLNTSISKKRQAEKAEEERKKNDQMFIDYMNAWAKRVNENMAKKNQPKPTDRSEQ